MTSLTAIVGIDPATGDEGVWGFQASPGMWLPMICADEERFNSILPQAIAMAKAENKSFRVFRFDNKVDITDEIEGLK